MISLLSFFKRSLRRLNFNGDIDGGEDVDGVDGGAGEAVEGEGRVDGGEREHAYTLRQKNMAFGLPPPPVRGHCRG